MPSLSSLLARARRPLGGHLGRLARSMETLAGQVREAIARSIGRTVAEAVALAWRWYLRLVERGKDPAAFVSALAGYAARAVRRGRRVCGQEAGQEVLSPRNQARPGFMVLRLPSGPTTLAGSPLEEALLDNAVTPPPEAAAFRIDFPAWRTARAAGPRSRRSGPA